MTLKPIGGNIVIDPTPIEKKTKSGIIIPATTEEKPNRGTVIAIGNGRELGGKIYPMQTKVGDTVIFGEHSVVDFKIMGKE